jgi:DNA polymerase-1
MSNPWIDKANRFVSFDTETHLIQKGLLSPPLVCASVAGPDVPGALLDKDQARDWFPFALDQDWVIVGANIAYDMLVMAHDAARRGIDLMPAIFRAYDEGRVYDIQIAEQLHAIAEGTLGKDPRTGMPLKGRYSLDQCVDLVLGRSNAKVNDRFRLSYALLEDIPIDQWPPEARQYPVDDAVNTLEVALVQIQAHKNLHNLSAQCYAAWAMHLGAAWGFTVDPEAVEALASKSEGERAKGLQQFIDAGILREDQSKDTALVKTKVAKAFGCTGKCPDCIMGRAASPTTGEPINCKKCAGTGLDLDSAPVPRTPTGGVETSRDALSESGDELLMEFAHFSEDAKILDTYVPYLREGVRNGKPVPINLRPNVILETGRSSYSGVIQLLPRKGGVRECFKARPGYVFGSCDYEGGELVTHAQSCLWLVGHSRLAEALIKDLKPHNMLGATLAQLDYEVYNQRLKSDKKLGDYRQAAKPANFGFPGGMGAVKMVLQQRKQGPDTTGPDGRVYKGLRFCILVGGETECGKVKVNEWKVRSDLAAADATNFRQIPPTCKRCIECADEIRQAWFKTFPENRIYFHRITALLDGPGYVTQHVSNRVRGGVEFCAAANGFFQGLLSDVQKTALSRASKECYTDRRSALWGSRIILSAHDELIAEHPIAVASEACQRLSDIMVESFKEYCPDLASACRAEPTLMGRWYKDAQLVRDESGRIVPWEP